MAKEKYEITNYGNTRTVYVKGQSWELTKNATIEVVDKEVADAFEELPYVDVRVIKQPIVKTPKKKKSSKHKKKVTPTKENKKIKRRKVKRRLKNE